MKNGFKCQPHNIFIIALMISLLEALQRDQSTSPFIIPTLSFPICDKQGVYEQCERKAC